VTPGQALWLPSTGARFTVEEVSDDGHEAIVRGQRLGGRLHVTAAGEGRYWARSVTDNGRSGSSLFDSLAPCGPRLAMREWPALGRPHAHDAGCGGAGCP
jgi:hypothetical protein